jgi:Ca-activated chloride channel family protein
MTGQTRLLLPASLRRFVRTGVLIFGSLLSAVGFGVAQEPPRPADDHVIRVEVRLVQVDAQVLQKKTGRPVGSLGKEDFELYEDGVRQQIAEVSRDQLPLSVVLLFDLTYSVRPVLKPLAAGALEALKHLKPEDEVAVMVYAASTQLLQDFTTDRDLAVAAIEKASEMESSEEAFFNQAVFHASQQLGHARNPRSRRALIWLTDNVPNLPHPGVPTEDEAFHEVFSTGTTVSALVERGAFSNFAMVMFSRNPIFAPSRSHNPPGDVYKYAARTGGDVMKSNKEEVSVKLAELIDEIRTRYTVGYYPAAPQPKGKFCQIKLQIRKETEKRQGSMVVRTRQGYYR